MKKLCVYSLLTLTVSEMRYLSCGFIICGNIEFILYTIIAGVNCKVEFKVNFN